MESGLSPARTSDLIIVGAGPTGGTLALAAAQSGLGVVLLDARSERDRTKRDGRNFAIVRGSWALMKSVGLTETLQDTAEPLNGLEAVDGGTHWFGAPWALFGTDDLEPREDGTPLGYMVEAEKLQSAIDNALENQDNLAWLAEKRFQSVEVESGHATVALEDGTTLRTQLLIGCDGVNSPVRNAADITTEGRSYGKSVFAANVKLSEPHNGIARQLFTPEGPFATLPLSGNRANLAWYMKTGAAETMAAMDKAEIEAELNARFAHFAGEMALDGPTIAYPLVLKIAQEMIAPRIALVGDAARRINPLAGQGLNLGLKDVAALAEVLEDSARAGLDIGSLNVLENYQSWRRFDANSTALGLDMIDRIFSNDSALLKPVRGLGLAAANRIGLLRRALARQASADQSSLPKRMR
ncbi:MAG: UbiH/UbiF/VisC/COQ6 family ubiquinone biosynthesis hydroxylase [Pseudomonadota bacterium]